MKLRGEKGVAGNVRISKHQRHHQPHLVACRRLGSIIYIIIFLAAYIV